MPIAAMIEGSAVAAVITNPRLADNPIVACNEAFEKLTGYAKDEIIGRNCRFLAGRTGAPLLVEELAEAVRERRPLLAEIPNVKKDGTPFLNAVLIVPIFDAAGELVYFLGSQSEVSAASPDWREERRRAAAERLKPLSPRQREVLEAMVAGKRNKEISNLLGISERTVKMHRSAAMATLNVGTSADAIRLAVEAEWPIAGHSRPVPAKAGDQLAPRSLDHSS